MVGAQSAIVVILSYGSGNTCLYFPTGIIVGVYYIVLRAFDDFIKPGGDLLSHTLRCSTIGAEGFNGRVRDGIG